MPSQALPFQVLPSQVNAFTGFTFSGPTFTGSCLHRLYLLKYFFQGNLPRASLENKQPACQLICQERGFEFTEQMHVQRKIWLQEPKTPKKKVGLSNVVVARCPAWLGAKCSPPTTSTSRRILAEQSCWDSRFPSKCQIILFLLHFAGLLHCLHFGLRHRLFGCLALIFFWAEGFPLPLLLSGTCAEGSTSLTSWPSAAWASSSVGSAAALASLKAACKEAAADTNEGCCETLGSSAIFSSTGPGGVCTGAGSMAGWNGGCVGSPGGGNKARGLGIEAALGGLAGPMIWRFAKAPWGRKPNCCIIPTRDDMLLMTSALKGPLPKPLWTPKALFFTTCLFVILMGIAVAKAATSDMFTGMLAATTSFPKAACIKPESQSCQVLSSVKHHPFSLFWTNVL